MVMAPAERLQRRDGERGVVDGREPVRLEPSPKPASGHAGVPMRLLEGDQGGQLEQVDEGRPWDLGPQRRLGEGDVASLDGPLEDRPR
jgi:hypothetical protein